MLLSVILFYSPLTLFVFKWMIWRFANSGEYEHLEIGESSRHPFAREMRTWWGQGQWQYIRRVYVPSYVWLFATPWTGAHQALLSVEFSMQKYWSQETCPLLANLSDPGFKPGSPALPAGFLPSEPPGKPNTSVGKGKAASSPSKNSSWLWTIMVLHYLGKEPARLDTESGGAVWKEIRKQQLSLHSHLPIPFLLPSSEEMVRTGAISCPRYEPKMFRLAVLLSLDYSVTEINFYLL